jgi:heme/copper-type cytochrome/quinol oxidase subunit 3
MWTMNNVDNVHQATFRGRLHVQFYVGIGVRFAAKGGEQGNFYDFFLLKYVYIQTIVMGVSRRIGSLSGLPANRACNRTRNRTRIRALASGHLLGAVYTCNFAYELPYDSVYDFLHKLVSNLFFSQYFLICFDKRL